MFLINTNPTSAMMFTSAKQNVTSLLANMNINPIQDGPFRCCSGWGGEVQKGPLPENLSHISYNMKLGTVIPHPKKIQKMYESRDTPLEFW